MKNMDKRIAALEVKAAVVSNKGRYIKPDNVDWLGNPLDSPATPKEASPGRGVDWLGFPINNLQRKL